MLNKRTLMIVAAFAALALGGCVLGRPGVYEHHVRVDPIEVKPVHVVANVNVRQTPPEGFPSPEVAP